VHPAVTDRDSIIRDRPCSHARRTAARGRPVLSRSFLRDLRDLHTEEPLPEAVDVDRQVSPATDLFPPLAPGRSTHRNR